MSGPGNAPVIIKRKKVVAGGGHHGGAWKVAYADFVTAMMAFFLLMWLLGATNEKQRKGIADFFNPTIPVNKVSGGGDGAFGGESVFSDQSLARTGTGALADRPGESRLEGQGESTEPSEAEEETAILAEAQEKLSGVGGESVVSELVRRHVTSRLTDEGLIVELFDVEGAPLFSDGDEATAVLSDLIGAVVDVFGEVENGIAVQAHVAATPVVLRDRPAWERSTARARRVRDLMEERGLPPQRFQRVTGFADRQPVAANPLSGRNNRVEVILLRSRL